MTIPLVQSLALKRFRSLRDTVVKLDNPTFLVGRNGAGKSNFVDAFSFLAEAMVSPLPAVFDRRGGVATVTHRTSNRGRRADLGMRVDLKDLDETTERAGYAFELRAVKDYGFKVVREQCVVVRKDGSKDWFARCDREFESSRRSLEPAPMEDALVLPLVGGHRRFRAVHQCLAEMAVYRIDPAVLREMQDPDDGARLHPDGRNAASVLREIWNRGEEDGERICEILASVVPHTVEVNPRRRGNKLALEFVQDWGRSEPVKLEAFGMSAGTLRALGLLVAVFQRPAPSVLVIEEPEATMHPGALGAVLDLLRHASRSAQVIVTTHSPDALDAKWIRNKHLRMMTWDAGVSHVARVSAATRETLCKQLAGAGELLRSNALTAAASSPSPDGGSLFQDLACRKLHRHEKRTLPSLDIRLTGMPQET